jgi:hypothetical protein
MPDIPVIKKATLGKHSRELLTATEAVRQGIATHAEKHVAAMRAMRAKLEEQRKLARSVKTP